MCEGLSSQQSSSAQSSTTNGNRNSPSSVINRFIPSTQGVNSQIAGGGQDTLNQAAGLGGLGSTAGSPLGGQAGQSGLAGGAAQLGNSVAGQIGQGTQAAAGVPSGVIDSATKALNVQGGQK